MVSKTEMQSKYPVRALWPIAVVAAAAALAAAGQITGCASPAYYWQAASGHMALMRDKRPVRQTIEAGAADEEVIAKLRLSEELRRFAADRLGLPDNGSYTEFVATGREAVVWNVVAAPEFSLEAKRWCFPVSGCVPYRGYFDREAAERFAGKLEKRGLDVAVSPAIAYSTLGWFDDPLLDTMWRQSDAQFAAYIFHELAHQALYIKGDAAFNESYASFVEGIGVQRWLRRRGESGALEEWLAAARANRDFNTLLRETGEILQAIYESGAQAPQMRNAKQAAFAAMGERYRQLREGRWRGRDYFGGWFESPPNNARFVLLDSYEGGVCAFEALYEEAGGDIHNFHALAREKKSLSQAERSRWLRQTCADIAPAGDL